MIGCIILNAVIHLGLLLPGSGRNEDICVERKESQQSRTTGCYGPSFGECTSTFGTSPVFSSSCLPCLHPAPLLSLTYCSKQVNKLTKEWIFFSSSVCFCFLERIGVYQSQKLPDHNKCGDSEWRSRVCSFQTAVSEVDCKGPDTRPGQSAHKRESGYVCF